MSADGGILIFHEMALDFLTIQPMSAECDASTKQA
ncbi:hypothetical protein FOXG_22177 [Fusarium oxysporum f. sp. lycopersici 4287]|uniref:Uncharacterized protein n=1 Tax=Fusarium oxysporum f. sp. lycopersici (strain 4287 / CBS 123668 / FGSC 9935 / NRRL 34936) TaxID=426428 RepID=A0A0J9W4G5_FUSO4|nr:hypothetical protein FOXG_22043 [Fusarium oxysporum f. sp. lycopersici 4287]XP_018256335.1 uncharacterized protein FOXG_22177 [Fusarium oxysporum f. sp. lycopersici 4287]KNB17775.1 hypothetical protein FOXG_22043 [Fusarium oxysporum f. sp. lycopersici 4287]KNB18290.1 hypothetical protein FOXG_22177 [Fusarium oxysporum f. sp. lycopersici 4287]